MKKSLIYIFLLFLMAQAHAEVILCEGEKVGKYLLALGESEGFLFKEDRGVLKELKGELQIQRYESTLAIAFLVEQSTVQWGEGECYTFGEPNIFITIPNEDEGSSLNLRPALIRRPGYQWCPLPNPMLPSPKPIVCKIIK